MYAAASWLFGCLAVALLAVGILAVSPQAAFADSGSCEEQCAAQCGAIYEEGTFEYYYCMNGCVYQCQMQQQNCTGKDQCAAGCSPNSQATGCNPGCSTQGPNCLNCRCIPTKMSPEGSVEACGCRP